MSKPLDKLKHHVTGAIERGEKQAIEAVLPTDSSTVNGWSNHGTYQLATKISNTEYLYLRAVRIAEISKLTPGVSFSDALKGEFGPSENVNWSELAEYFKDLTKEVL